MEEHANLPDLDRAHPLIDKFVKTDGFSHPSNIVIRVLEGRLNVGPTTTKAYRFEVTDSQDLQVLYFMDIHEGNFQHYKENSKLTVAFGGFPDVAIDLIERCLQGPVPSNFANKPDVTFGARLDLDTCIFTIYEDTTFSKVEHMSIQLTCGDDNAIKHYLASRLNLSMEVASQRGARVAELEQGLQTEKAGKEELQNRFNDLQIANDSEKERAEAVRSTERNQVERAHADELRRLTEEAAGKQERLAVELDGVKRLLADKHEELRTTCTANEKTILDLQRRVQDLQGALDREKDSRTRLENDYQLTVGSLGEKQGSLSDIQKDLAVRVQTISTLQGEKQFIKDALDEQRKQTARAEAEAREHKISLLEREAELKEVGKALGRERESVAVKVEEMGRMQQRVARMETMVKEKNDIMRRQESKVQFLEREVVRLKQELQASQDRARGLEQSIARLEEQVAAQAQDLDQKVQQIEAATNANTYLQEQLSQLQLGVPFSTPQQAKHVEEGYFTGLHTSPPPTEPAYRYPTTSTMGGTAGQRGGYDWARDSFGAGDSTPALAGARSSAYAVTGDTYAAKFAVEDAVFTTALGSGGAKSYAATYTSSRAGVPTEQLLPSTEGDASSFVDLEHLDYYAMAGDVSLEPARDASPPERRSRIPQRLGVK